MKNLLECITVNPDIFGSGPGLGPAKADAVLVIDPDRVLSGSIALQFLEPTAADRKADVIN